MSCIEISVLKKKGNIEKQFTFVTIEDPSKNLEWSYFEKKKKGNKTMMNTSRLLKVNE